MKDAGKKGPSRVTGEAIRKGFLQGVVCEIDGFPQVQRDAASVTPMGKEVWVWERASKMKSHSPWKTSREEAASLHQEAKLTPQ